MDFYIKLFSALLTPMIAITTTYIAIQQYKLQKLKLRREMFDRQLVVYKAVMGYLASIMQSDDSAAETADVHFLFKPDITDFIETLYNKGLDLELKNEELKDPSNSREKKKIAQEKLEIRKFLGAQFKITKQKFHEYLAVDI